MCLRAWCRYTRGRFECAHGGRFERTHGERGGCVGERGEGVSVTHQHQHQHIAHQRHTTHDEQTHNTQHRTRKVALSVLFTKICPRRVITWPQRSTKETNGSYPFFSLRTGRKQHVADSSNHSLCLIKLFSFSALVGISNQMVRFVSPLLLPPSSTTTTHNTQHTETQRHRDLKQDVHASMRWVNTVD